MRGLQISDFLLHSFSFLERKAIRTLSKAKSKSYNIYMKETIVSGIRATGKLHVGNYLGALKQFVELQDTHAGNCYFFIADLHALTTPFEPKELSQNTLEVAAEYLAVGIDPKKSIFFLQSQVQEHAELAWIFNCLTPLGELERMTQYKDKSKSQKESINGGLLTYPALMAADILLYKPSAVPVGHDQFQHLELTRDVARKFNNRFGKTFPEPKTFEKNAIRVMSLIDPTKKMSKTNDEALMLDDTPEEVSRKLRKAVTATESGDKSDGVFNLLLLHMYLEEETDKATPLTKQFNLAQKNGTIKFSELKDSIAKLFITRFEKFRQDKENYLKNPKELQVILTDGAAKARKVAQQTMTEVKEKIGLIGSP
jgi:tryptophanyl-tRNA synthetase